MSKIRTVNELQNILDKEFSWRLKEIANLKIVVRTSEVMSKSTAVRAALPLLYGHWEGFIKKASTYYLEYINGQRLPYRDLKSCFIVFGLKRKINDVIASKNSEVSIETLDFLRNELSNKAKLMIDAAIRTEFNLSSNVFKNIAKSIDIDISPYEPRFNLIDESLLNRRNHIAHGEYIDIDPDGFRELADEVLLLLRRYKTDIENAVSQGDFKVSA